MTTKAQRNRTKRFKSVLSGMPGHTAHKMRLIAKFLGKSVVTVEIWNTKNGAYRTIPEKHIAALEAHNFN